MILIVEDDKASYTLLKFVLKKSNFEIIWVNNGEDAIFACKENSGIELVLMDISLPSISGYGAAKEIKKFNPNLPIIAQTAFAFIGDREKAMSAGCDDYISKPIKQEILLEKVSKFLSN